MRVLFWNQEYFPSIGGVEVHTGRLARALADRGHSVSVVTGLSADSLADRELVDGIEVFRLPLYQVLTTRDLDRLAALRSEVARIKRQLRPQIVHVNMTDASPLVHLMTTSANEITIMAFRRGLEEMPGVRGLAEGLVRRASALLAPSVHAAQNVARFLGLPHEQVLAIENGLPTAAAASPPLPDLPAPKFLFVGRIVAEKGVDIALRALRRLHDSGIEAELAVAGAGPARPELEAMIRQSGLERHVSFLGVLHGTAMERAYSDATAVLIPSIFAETFCSVAAEAGLAGRPSIVSRIGALPETVVEGVTGLVFSPGEDDVLAGLMSQVIATPGLARQLGEAGRVRARQLYSIDRMADRYEELYNSVLGGATIGQHLAV